MLPYIAIMIILLFLSLGFILISSHYKNEIGENEVRGFVRCSFLLNDLKYIPSNFQSKSDKVEKYCCISIIECKTFYKEI